MATRRILLKAHDLKQVMRRYLDRLREHREALNRLNVYPVPDGDTGTNMALTVESVVEAADAAEGMDQVATAIAHGSLMGAQGNSGIILSQILRGLADAFRDQASFGSAQLVDALDRASAAAYRAVGRPVEGTILTVLREAAEAAGAADTPEGEDLASLLLRVYRHAEKTLERTPELLPVLKDAGVVDAGGAGFLLLLASFLEEVTGEDVVLPDAIFRAAVATVVPASDDLEANLSGLRYEVMYLLHGDADDVGDRLREAWAGMGDSIVVVGGEGVWNCHIHTDEIGPAIEAGIALGRPERIAVTDLLDQVETEARHRGTTFEPLAGFADADVGVVAVALGDGVVDLFRDAGVQGVVAGGQTMNPSVRDVLAVVEAVQAPKVVVLPNNRNIVPVAQQVDALTTKQVSVVPTRSAPEGLAAMFGYMPGEEMTTIVEGMTDAALGCRSGEVTRAVRDARTPVGEISSGDWLGLVDGEVAFVRPGEAEAAVAVLDAIVDGGSELVTLIVGRDASSDALVAIRRHLDLGHGHVDVTEVDGGQPLYPYLIGVE